MSESAADAASDITDAYVAKLNSVAPGAIWIQLALMSAIGLGALLLFSFLRPNNSVIYQPKVKYSEDGKAPPKIAKGVFSWVKPLLTVKEDVLMDTIGLDAVTYLRFLRMCRNMFMAVALLSCATLLPVNVAYNITKNVKNRTYISALSIKDVRGNWLWAHVAITYLVTFIAFYFIWVNYAAMVKLRWQWFRSPEYQNSLHSRSIVITQVSKAHKSDSGIAALLSSLQVPYPTTAVHIARRVGNLPELIEAHNDAVRALEGVLTSYFKDPEKLPAKRPTMRLGGAMGCGGQKVDAIDHLTEKIKAYEQRIEQARTMIHEKKPENYGFASFESVPYAHVVGKKLFNKRKNGSKFELAPMPNDIMWKNITRLDRERRSNRVIGAILLTLFCFFYTIPLLAVSILANITALSGYVRFIRVWQDQYSFLMSAFVGIVPPLLSVLLQLLLPMIIRWISRNQGATTKSQSDRFVTARYSAFLLITQFFIFSVIGVIVNMISSLVATIQSTNGSATGSAVWQLFKKVPDQLQSTWIIQSSYWLTVFPLRGASSIFDLAQVVSLLLVWVRTRLFGRTPREIREWTKPPVFDFAVYFSNHILIVAVAFVYTPLQPLVPLFGACAFFVSALVYKYQLMYVCTTRSETGGRLWRVVINRVLVALIMMQLLMLLTIGLQRGWYNSISLAPPILMVLVFKVVLKRQFDDKFTWFIPSETEMAETYLHQSDQRKNRLQKRFGHPSLQEPLFTPMLHKNVQHLLPTIYRGRIEQGRGDIDGKAVTQHTVGGLTFNMLGEHDLAMGRGEYLRQRDEDAMTVSTTPGIPPTKYEGAPPYEQDYFAERRAEYLKHGAAGGIAQTPDENYELSRMVTGQSTDNLIQYPPSGGPQGRQLHRHNPSQASFDSLAAAGMGNDMEMVQQQQQQYYGYGGQSYPPAGPQHIPRGASGRTSPFDEMSNFRPQHSHQDSRESLAGMNNNNAGFGAPGGFAPLPTGPQSPEEEFRSHPLEQQMYSRTPSPGPNAAYGARASSPGPHTAYGSRPTSPGPNNVPYGASRPTSPGPNFYSGGGGGGGGGSRPTSPGPNNFGSPRQQQGSPTPGSHYPRRQ